MKIACLICLLLPLSISAQESSLLDDPAALIPRPASLSLPPAGGGRGCVKPGLSLDVAQVESITFHVKGLRFVWSRFNYRSTFSGESRYLTFFRPTFFSHNPLSSYDTECGIGSIVVEGDTVCKLARAAVVLRSLEKPT